LITDNKKARGAAIFAIYSALNVIGNDIVNNQAEADGGSGLCLMYSTGNIANNRISGNTTLSYGGGFFIENCNSNLSVYANKIESNSAFFGGAIYALNSSSKFTDNLIIGNSSNSTNAGEYSGGAILVKDDNNTNLPVTFTNNIISNNSSATDGGAITIVYAYADFIGNLITNNQATSKGGAVYFHAGSSDKVKLINNTIANNNANGKGGAIYFNYGADVDMKNCLVYGNNAALGKQFYFAANSGANNNVLSASYSDIQNGQNGFAYDSGIAFNGTYANNLDADPLFDNTGNLPYSIQANSPCKNTGTPDVTGLNLSAYDLAGFARIQDGRVDIGAYEYGTVLDIGSSAQKKSPVIIKSYPNPFNNRTQINFNLGDKSMVNLSVYNASGQKVKHLLSSVLSAGEHSIGFNADNLNTGVYFVRLKTADFSTETKVVLTK